MGTHASLLGRKTTNMTDLFEALSNMFNPGDKMYELNSIQMAGPVITGSGVRTAFLSTDMTIRVVNNEIVDCPEPTHKIIGCHGTINSSELYFVLTDLKTNEPLNLKVK